MLTRTRKAHPDMKAAELIALKRAVDTLPDYTLINTLDNKTIVKAEGGAAPAAAAAPTPAPRQRPRNRRRIRVMRG